MGENDVTWVLHYKILCTRNVRQMYRFRSKLVSCILPVTNTLALKNALAYYEICTYQTCNVFIVQAPGDGVGATRTRMPPDPKVNNAE